MRPAFLFFGILTFISPLRGQTVAFESSHYARAIGMGNAFTGVADGIETIHYNTAGLANLQTLSFIYSSGQGYALFLKDAHVSDYALAVPIPGDIGVAGISYGRQSDDYSDFIHQVLNVHFARKIIPGISAGLDAHYYSYSGTGRDEANQEVKLSGHTFDISPSLLYTYPDHFIESLNDRLQVGMKLKHALALKGTVEPPHPGKVEGSEVNKQQLRVGASYSVTPPMDEIEGFTPVRILLAGDIVFLGTRYPPVAYSFDVYQPNYGVEITLLEILRLRYGRENEVKIEETAYTYSPQHPVNRFGIGIVIPLSRMKEFGIPVELEVDYSISDWQKIDESTGRTTAGYYYNIPMKKDAFSLKLNAAW